MKLENKVHAKFNLLTDEELGGVLVELPRKIKALGCFREIGFTHYNSNHFSVIDVFVNAPKCVHGMLEFQSMKKIHVEISRDDCYSSFERSLTKIPDLQQYSAAILPLGKFRAIGEKRWRMVEHQKAVRADTELHVLVAEIAQVIVDVINHQNLKQVGACPRTTAK
jgi:hypothetical protein